MLSDRVDEHTAKFELFNRLNPCSNGICSLIERYYNDDIYIGLNPCSNGICSLIRETVFGHILGVLILVLMEYAL